MSAPRNRVRGIVELPAGRVEPSPKNFVRAYSDPGDAIYDPFLGSGSTVLAADKFGRVGYGTEISARYVAVTLERLTRAGLIPRRIG